MKVLAIFITFLVIVHSEKARYDNYRVYSVEANTQEQLDILKLLVESQNAMKFWKLPREVGMSADIVVPPGNFAEFSQIMTRNNFVYNIMIENLQRLIDDEQPSGPLKREFSWERYYTLTEIYQWLDDVVKNNPEVVTPFVVGKSYEGRDIRGVKISYKSGNSGVFLEANIHAREWVASATATFVINELLTSQDPRIRNVAENVDWYIVPVLNVDGFAYSHEKDRMWRKTRQAHSPVCVGADPNRNFDSHWMENGGATSNPCSETYAGPKPFSEPETKAVAEFVQKIKDKINVYIAYHTYGQWLLSPYGHTGTQFPPNYRDMQQIAKNSVEAIAKRYNTPYVYGSTGSTLYVASGTSPDWAYDKSVASLGYTFEFRDKGKYGFVLPASQILPNALEATDGLVALVEEAQKLKYL